MEDTKLATLENYLKKNKSLAWEGQGLLLSFIKFHNPVVSLTISGWIKIVLREARKDTEIFKGHSSRTASTSKTELGDFPRQTFQKEVLGVML